MARQLRIEYSGAVYHVMNRGNQRQNVFQKKEDCELFLEKLWRYSSLFSVEIYSYCLMKNHFHLLLKTREANLSRFMQSLLTSFTIVVNRRNNNAGHLFQGRFKSQLVEDQKYLSIVSRYIHLNPVRTVSNKNLTVIQKKNMLVNYTWSSFSACVGLVEAPESLEIAPVILTWGKSLKDKMMNYRKYTEEGVYKEIDNPFELAIRQQIIGSESFAEKIMRRNILNQSVIDKREQLELRRFQHSFSVEKIIGFIALIYKVDRREILKRKSKCNFARKLAMYLCCNYCTANKSLTKIGEDFSVSLSGLTRARDRVMENLQQKEVKDSLDAFSQMIKSQ